MLYLTNENMVTLECPICMGENLHNKKIEIFEIEKKLETGKIMLCEFWCENCELNSSLVLFEDHGTTGFYWDDEDENT